MSKQEQQQTRFGLAGQQPGLRKGPEKIEFDTSLAGRDVFGTFYLEYRGYRLETKRPGFDHYTITPLTDGETTPKMLLGEWAGRMAAKKAVDKYLASVA